MSISDLLYKRSNKVMIKVASPVLVIPFKAHNSKFIGEPESERDRLWMLNLGNLNFMTNDEKSNGGLNEIDEYERFKLTLDSINF
jgi:hypothetical protein